MPSQAQITANRKNAKKSTGPKTPQGKAAVAQNALKHGLTATKDVVITENQADFDLHRDRFMQELDPWTMTEFLLATRIVSLAWRLQRAVNVQDQAIDAIQDENNTGNFARESRCYPYDCDPSLNLGRIVYHDFTHYGTFEKLLNYERRIESSLYRTMNHLKSLQRSRTANHNGKPAITKIEHRESNIEHQASAIEHRESNIPNTTSDILHTTFAHTTDPTAQNEPKPPHLAHGFPPNEKDLPNTNHETQNQPDTRRLAHGPVPWVTSDQDESTASAQSNPQTPPTPSNKSVSIRVNPCQKPIPQNKPNFKIPQTTPTTLMQRIYRHTAACDGKEKQTQYSPVHEAAHSEHPESRSKVQDPPGAHTS